MYRWVRGFLDEHELPGGVGAGRLVGERGVVTVDIEPNDTARRGRVAVGAEVWGALSKDNDPVPAGTRVRIAAVVGTRVVVEPIPPGDPDQGHQRGRDVIAIIIIAAVAIVLIAFLINAVKIVRPFQRGLVERLGRYKTTKDPGFNLIMPFIETMQLVDMREQVVDVPPQEVITSDNVVVSVDAVVYYEATDPQRLSTTSPTSSRRSPSSPRPTCAT